MQDIQAWIIQYFAQEGLTALDAQQPLFQQIDSFSVIGFLLACDEHYPGFDRIDTDGLAQLNIAGIAGLIKQTLS